MGTMVLIIRISELEKARMKVVLLDYLGVNSSINSTKAAELLNVEVKTASRLLAKAEKIQILMSEGKTKKKVYHMG